MMKRRLFAATAALTIALSSLLLTGCGGSVKGEAMPDATELFYVYDEASVLSPEEENYIVTQNDALFALTGAQIVVACVDTTGAVDMGDYAYMLFNEWGIGSAERDNGILVLLSIGEDDYWTLQGEGLEDTLPSGILKTMQNEYLEPDFAAKDYGAGVLLYFDALVSHLETAYSVDLDTWNGAAGDYTPAQGDETAVESSGSSLNILIGAIAIVIVILVIVMIVNASRGGGGGSGGGTRKRTSSPTVTIPRTVYRGGYYPNPRPTVRPPSRPSGGMGGFSGGGFSGGGMSRGGGGGSSRGGGAGRR